MSRYLPVLLCIVISTAFLPTLFLIDRRDESLGSLIAETKNGTLDKPITDPITRMLDSQKGDAYVLLLAAVERSQYIPSLRESVSRYRKNEIHPQPGEMTAIIEVDRLLSEAAQVDGFDGIFWLNRGWLALAMGDADRALKYSSIALQRTTNDSSFYVARGLFLENSGENAEAEDAYAAALLLNPRIVDSRFFSDLRERLPSNTNAILEKAIATLTVALERTGSPITSAKLGKLLLYQGNLSAAYSRLESALERLPNLEGAWLNLGDIHTAKRQLAKAIDCYRKAAYLLPNDPLPYFKLGMALLAEGRSDEAMTSFLYSADNYDNRATEHSDRVWLMYHTSIRIRNDLLPLTLLDYLAPLPSRSELDKRLADTYRQLGRLDLAAKYDECAKSQLD